MPEPKCFSPVLFFEFRTGVSMEEVRTCNFFSPSAPKSIHIHEIGSEILDQMIHWFRDLRTHRIGMKELEFRHCQESSCTWARQSKHGRRKSIVTVLSPVLSTFSTLSHSFSKELWGVIMRN